jgi:hypothetical protein
LVARSTAKDTNVAGRTEWEGDLELLLVEDKDHLVAKVGRVSAPVAMDLLAVVLGWLIATSWGRKPQNKYQESGAHA